MPKKSHPHLPEKIEREAAWCFRKGIQGYSWVVVIVIMVVVIVWAGRLLSVGAEKIEAKGKVHWQQKGPRLPGTGS